MANKIEVDLNLSQKSGLIELEIEYQKLKKNYKIEKKRLDRLGSQLQNTKQQIEFYTHEYQKALENMKDCNWKITKETCKELRKNPSPSKTIIDICEKLMLILDQPEKNFQAFKLLSKNFGFLKDLMSAVQGQALSENIISEVLPIWKNQGIIQAKLLKTSKCASLFAQWISFIVEFSLKKETVNSSKKKEPEIEKKIKTQNYIMNDLSQKLEKLKENIGKIKLFSQAKHEEVEEISEKFCLVSEKGKPFGFTMHRGTASGGILGNSLNSHNFPNFNDAELYEGVPVKDPIEENIVFETGSETFGCCRLKFFCF